MDDGKIIELFFERSENAISAVGEKYGGYCLGIARNILRNREDEEECLNDTYLKVWNSIPPQRPSKFIAFIGRIARNSALNMYERRNAAKRGGGEVSLVLDELTCSLPQTESPELAAEGKMLTEALNRFLGGISEDSRRIFVKRYFYMCSVKDISYQIKSSESKVKMSLLRTRNDLKLFLEREEINI